jgi:hypothetical protein
MNHLNRAKLVFLVGCAVVTPLLPAPALAEVSFTACISNNGLCSFRITGAKANTSYWMYRQSGTAPDSQFPLNFNSLNIYLTTNKNGAGSVSTEPGPPYVGDIIVASDTLSPPVEDYRTVLTKNCVPGPLPLFGVGAALGFSRKLKMRIRQAVA